MSNNLLKNVPLCANTHHGVRDLEVHWVVRNTRIEDTNNGT